MNPLTVKLYNALQVVVSTPSTRSFLEQHDPMALKQAFEAINETFEAEKKRLRPDNDVDDTKPQVIRVTMEMTPSETYPTDKQFRGEMAQNVWDLVRKIESYILWMQLQETFEGASEQLKEALKSGLIHDLEKARELVKSMKIEVVNQE